MTMRECYEAQKANLAVWHGDTQYHIEWTGYAGGSKCVPTVAVTSGLTTIRFTPEDLTKEKVIKNETEED